MSRLGSDIAESARKGAVTAAKHYYKMSVDGNIWTRGIETYISSKIAEQIFKDSNYPVELELSYKNILERFGLNYSKNKHSTLNQTSRFDVSVHRKNNKKPYGIIEVKKRFAAFKLQEDIRRIVDAINTCNKADKKGLRFGLIIVLEPIRENQKKHAEEKIDELLKKMEDSKEFRFLDDFDVEIEWNVRKFDSGTSNRGVQIKGVCAYSILFNENKF